MEMTEVLRVSPGAGPEAKAAPREGGWGLRLLPAGGSLLRRREFHWAVGAGFILALSYLRPWYIKLPGGGSQLCWFYRLTGIPCLLCGMTRSLAAAARLRIGESFYLHLLGPFLFLFLLLLFLGSLAALFTNQRVGLSIPRGVRSQLSWFLLAALVAAWVLKLAAFGVNV